MSGSVVKTMVPTCKIKIQEIRINKLFYQPEERTNAKHFVEDLAISGPLSAQLVHDIIRRFIQPIKCPIELSTHMAFHMVIKICHFYYLAVKLCSSIEKSMTFISLICSLFNKVMISLQKTRENNYLLHHCSFGRYFQRYTMTKHRRWRGASIAGRCS